MAYNKKGYYRRARMIQEVTRRYYEPERQDRCYAAVWRKHIYPVFGVCYAAYLRYLKATPPPEVPHPSQRQLALFDDRA